MRFFRKNAELEVFNVQSHCAVGDDTEIPERVEVSIFNGPKISIDDIIFVESGKFILGYSVKELKRTSKRKCRLEIRREW